MEPFEIKLMYDYLLNTSLTFNKLNTYCKLKYNEYIPYNTINNSKDRLAFIIISESIVFVISCMLLKKYIVNYYYYNSDIITLETFYTNVFGQNNIPVNIHINEIHEYYKKSLYFSIFSILTFIIFLVVIPFFIAIDVFKDKTEYYPLFFCNINEF